MLLGAFPGYRITIEEQGAEGDKATVISEVTATTWDHLGILQQIEAVNSTEPRTGA